MIHCVCDNNDIQVCRKCDRYHQLKPYKTWHIPAWKRVEKVPEPPKTPWWRLTYSRGTP